MIDAIIHWSLANRLVVLLAAAVLLALGVRETLRMPVDVFPDLTAPTVTVVAEAHGMAPEEVETLLTFPLESALGGAGGVRRVRSQTSVGIAVLSVDFAWGTDLLQARQVVAERLQLLDLPPEVDRPVMGPTTSIMGDILFIGLTSDAPQHTPMDLRDTADRLVVRHLRALPGVAQVLPIGGDERQFQVLLNPARLDAWGLSADDVAHALEDGNQNTSAGLLIEGGQENLIHGLGRVQSEADIAATLVAMRGGLPVKVGDLGQVKVGAALKRGEGGVNGQLGVVIGVRKQPNVNTLRLTKQIETELARLKLPEGMTLHPALFRQADFIQVAVDNVSTALRDGAVLVVAIVLLFLASGRATLITALAIPLSLVAAILAMAWQGIEINTMTLGGMAIAVGALVDDAIIDVENVARRLRQAGAGVSPALVVFRASKEIRRSIVFATVIIVLVFLPLFFLEGVEGRLLRPLGFAYSVSLAASLVVALTVTPALCALLLPASRAVRNHQESRVVALLKRAYDPALRLLVPRWKTLAVVSLVALGGAGFALWQAGRSFLPPFNEGALTLSVVTLPGTALAESSQLARRVEQVLLTHPEVVSTARLTGRAAGDEHAQAVSASEIEVRLRPTGRGEAAFLAALRTDLAQVPGVVITVGQPLEHRIDHMLSGSRANIAVKIFGNDLAELRRLAEEARRVMAAVPGVVDLAVEPQVDVPFVTVRFLRDAIARHGLTIEQVSHEIETAFGGRVVGRVLQGAMPYDLVVRYESSAVDTLEAVQEARIGAPGGARLPLHVLAEVQHSVGPHQIGRENGERRIVLSCNVAGRDLSAVVEDMRAGVDPLPRPAGYRVEYGGQFESAEAAARTLLWVSLGVLAGIFVLLFLALGTLRDALLVAANLPLALIGGVGGVYLAGGVVSVASLIGFITLFGIATRNGIMMITHFQHLVVAEGVTDPDEVVRRGALERLSPILMTALAAGLGLLPLALALGEPGSEIQAPMAMVLLCGLATSTLLNLLVIPALYRRFGSAVR